MRGKEAWLANVHVRPVPGSGALGSPDRIGAYVNILALAGSEEEYKAIVLAELDKESFIAIEFEDVDTVEGYVKSGFISEELDELRNSLSEETPIQYKTFHCYSADDA